MAEYLILIYGDEAHLAADEEARATSFKQHNEFIAANGDAIRGGNALLPTETATSVRRDDEGMVLVTDAPFVETKEALGGYYLIEAQDLDAAIAIATQVPVPYGGVEVRPIMDLG